MECEKFIKVLNLCTIEGYMQVFMNFCVFVSSLKNDLHNSVFGKGINAKSVRKFYMNCILVRTKLFSFSVNFRITLGLVII